MPTSNTIVTSVKDEVIKLAQSQVGYKEGPKENQTKYSQYFDTPVSKNGPYPYFNGKKQYVAWCAIFINWLFVMVLRPILGSPDKVRQWLGEPKPADNCAAGCPYFWQYLKAKKWQVDKKAGQPGDIIFFNAKCTHVGIIEKVDANKYYTIEGNKNNAVTRCTYSRTSASIYGIMRPDYASVDPKVSATPAPEPKPEPKPEVKPTPAPTYKKYKVSAKSGLNVRRGPAKSYGIIKTLSYGSTVTVYETKKGWGRIGSSQWCSTTYLKKA